MVIQASMDGKGSYRDNLFIERLWRTVKYEEVYLKAYQNGRDARVRIGEYLCFYNTQRPHQALDYRTPAEVYLSGTKEVPQGNLVQSGEQPISAEEIKAAGPDLSLASILSD